MLWPMQGVNRCFWEKISSVRFSKKSNVGHVVNPASSIFPCWETGALQRWKSSGPTFWRLISGKTTKPSGMEPSPRTVIYSVVQESCLANQQVQIRKISFSQAPYPSHFTWTALKCSETRNTMSGVAEVFWPLVMSLDFMLEKYCPKA